MSSRRPVNPLYQDPTSFLSDHHHHHNNLPSPSHSPETDSSPSDARPSASTPEKDYYPHQRKSLAGIALRAFLLGASLLTGLLSAAYILLTTTSPLWRLPFFLSALSLFHFLEFWTTAAYNTPQATVYAFLLTANWPAYAIAHATAFAECLVSNLVFGGSVWAPFGTRPLLVAAGFALVFVGQAVRSLAMITAGESFNHTVQHYKAESHTLVTGGIYGWFRHPSYFGFFWWAIGTQLVMGNVLSLCGYAGVLWFFFSKRMQHEEELLIRFFGDDYVRYRKSVGTLIPFCG
ncbi:prenyl cysteine carboxyl methyltransferase ste14 [Colletotrichum karsti]|uniref:Protein-S-isoprenylcysteine O-methyltransferase n=1 Tax=Colletotrichum karsti TaxID=1095194 RepID=A0A9P6HX90_9PEZI|nr:prenyl cysteine carboxyl methyltransferase ste14 [Colletotrichum karsti]KAF9871702.1 prenyl cysteine carboxyl methyltransferase ste14 [Colletotrichum karsti]